MFFYTCADACALGLSVCSVACTQGRGSPPTAKPRSGIKTGGHDERTPKVPAGRGLPRIMRRSLGVRCVWHILEGGALRRRPSRVAGSKCAATTSAQNACWAERLLSLFS